MMMMMVVITIKTVATTTTAEEEGDFDINVDDNVEDEVRAAAEE